MFYFFFYNNLNGLARFLKNIFLILHLNLNFYQINPNRSMNHNTLAAFIIALDGLITDLGRSFS